LPLCVVFHPVLRHSSHLVDLISSVIFAAVLIIEFIIIIIIIIIIGGGGGGGCPTKAGPSDYRISTPTMWTHKHHYKNQPWIITRTSSTQTVHRSTQ